LTSAPPRSTRCCSIPFPSSPHCEQIYYRTIGSCLLGRTILCLILKRKHENTSARTTKLSALLSIDPQWPKKWAHCIPIYGSPVHVFLQQTNICQQRRYTDFWIVRPCSPVETCVLHPQLIICRRDVSTDQKLMCSFRSQLLFSSAVG
jgi:hypothetical protein